MVNFSNRGLNGSRRKELKSMFPAWNVLTGVDVFRQPIFSAPKDQVK